MKWHAILFRTVNKLKEQVAKNVFPSAKKKNVVLRSASVLAKQAPLALSNVAGYGEAF